MDVSPYKKNTNKTIYCLLLLRLTLAAISSSKFSVTYGKEYFWIHLFVLP